MPVYEFRCQDCGRLSRIKLSFAEYDNAQPLCPSCQSQNLRRRIGRIAITRSEDARLDAMMDDTALAALDEEDPKAIGQFMRKMSREMGEDLGDDFDEVVDRLESGESPDEIEKSMPGLADGMGGMDDF